MKKIYSLFIGLSLAVSAIGQTFISEDFTSNLMPPEGWSIPAFAEHFECAPTDSAGGVAPECKITGWSYNGTIRLSSPIISTAGISSATLIFKHKYDKRTSPSPTIGVATKSAGIWNTVWQLTPSADLGPEEIQVTISNGDMNKPYFQFCFFVTGAVGNMNYWYIDDILFMVPLELDGKLANLSFPSTITSPPDAGGVFQNLGNTPVTEFSASYQAYNGVIYDTTISGLDLGLFEMVDFSFGQPWLQPFGFADIHMWLNSVNGITDNFTGNDTINRSISYVPKIVPRKVTFEEFTSSTCGPCASFNSGFVPWCEQHPDITLVKYQMNWPGSGDPYYTAEGGVRRSFYGVSYVPDLFYNGTRIATGMTAVQNSYNQGLSLTSYIDIASSFTISGTFIHVTTNIIPWANVGQVKVLTIVLEKVTTGNVSSNGETEFHHVMMDMLPDGSGALVNLEYGNPVQFDYNVNLANTNVEEYDDLLVAVLVQSTASTKDMLQSAYGEQDKSYSPEARLDMIYIDGVSVEGFDPDVYEYDVILPEGTVFEPYMEVSTMDENALALVNMAFQVPGTAVVDVYAENLYNTKRYLVHYVIETGVDDKVQPMVQVYPNPATGTLNVAGLKDASLKLFSANGAEMISLNNFSGGAIDVSEIPAGIYILNVTTLEGTVVRKKVVIY